MEHFYLDSSYANWSAGTKIISSKTAELFAAATKVGAILSEMKTKEKEALEFF